MFRKLLKRESGYSLVEVMASIIILTIAILPMAGMFEMGLQTATKGSNYDKARTLANLKMEEAKSISYANLESSFPVSPSTPDSTSGYYDSGFIQESGPTSADFTNFEYRVEKQYMKRPDTAPDTPSIEFAECDAIENTCSTETDLMRITVTVQWADGNEYRTFGLVTA